VGPFGWTWRAQISKEAAKPEFKKAIRESIGKEGIRNPILVWSFNEGIFLTFGGSRIMAAVDVGLDSIPAIINDYTGDYESGEEVTEVNYHTFFADPPRDAEFTEKGFDYHYNLERARQHNHDKAGFAWVEGTPSWIKKEFPWL
jgi:hypothetical protein